MDGKFSLTCLIHHPLDVALEVSQDRWSLRGGAKELRISWVISIRCTMMVVWNMKVT